MTDSILFDDKTSISTVTLTDSAPSSTNDLQAYFLIGQNTTLANELATRANGINQWTLLMQASYDGNVDEAIRLLTQSKQCQSLPNFDYINAKSSKHHGTALMVAADHGHYDIVRMLCECGADVNAQDAEGWTALHFAANRGFIEICGLLQCMGANSSLMTTDKMTANDLARDFLLIKDY